MTTQREVAERLGISQPAVQKSLQKMGIKDWKTKSLDNVVHRYVAKLIAQASAHEGKESKISLVDARIKRELVETRLSELKVAREEGRLVDMDQLFPVLQSLFQGMKQKIMGRATKLKTKLDALYGIDVDIEILEEEDEGLLNDLAKYIEGHCDSIEEAIEGDIAASEDEHD